MSSDVVPLSTRDLVRMLAKRRNVRVEEVKILLAGLGILEKDDPEHDRYVEEAKRRGLLLRSEEEELDIVALIRYLLLKLGLHRFEDRLSEPSLAYILLWQRLTLDEISNAVREALLAEKVDRLRRELERG